MWGNNDNPFDKTGGGFIAGANESPAPEDKRGGGKRSQNVIPVTIRQLVSCPEDVFTWEGFEAHVVTVVGVVQRVVTATTKISTWLDDQTGAIECINYMGTDESKETAPTVLCEGTYGKVVGALRKGKEGKYLLIYKSSPVTDLNELNCHLLEVIQTGITLKRLRQTEEQKANAGGSQFQNTFSNSMIKPGLGGPTGTSTGGSDAGGGIQGFTARQNQVHRIIANCRDDQGMHKNDIISAVKGSIPMKELMEILEFLSNEGHVFSTVDDDHFKATDSQYA